MGVPISNVTRRVVYAASGTGPYAFTFEILANTDIAVYRDDTLLTLTTDYSVSIASNGTGSITLVASPTGATQIAIVGNRTIQRTTDFVTGGDFFANTVNDEMDQQTIFAQQNAEGLLRALSAPQTDPTTINMVLPRASLRANKALGFDADGNPAIADTLGTNRGNWAASTLYYVRDIVKDTTNSNIWQCIVQHTSTGSQPISTNTDSAKWTLLVDAAAAAESASDAADSATAAASSASSASSSASAASSSASAASTSASNASTSATSAASSASAASSSASTASTAATNAGNSATAAATSATSASNSASAASTSASNASSSASAASTSSSNAATSATNASNSATAASGSASTAATQATNASNSATAAAGSATSAASAQTAAEAARDATLAAYDSFDDRYLGAKTSDPSVDNDGNALVAGALYFNSTDGAMKLYTGSAWVAAYVSGSGYLASANNLSDVASASTARTNLGLAIGTNVQAWDADLDTWATKTAPSGTVVGTSDTQTLTNKTITTPTLTNPNITTGLTIAGSAGTSGQVLTSAGSGSAPSWTTLATPAGASLSEFTSSGTWTKPSGITFVMVECWGAGGGGGGGSRWLNTSDKTGGSGGGGGAYAYRVFKASDLGSTVTVTIGAGGAGGTAVSSNSDGVNGSDGGNTTFGSSLTAYGGGGGEGGKGDTAGGARGGAGGGVLSAATNTSPGFPYQLVNSAGGYGGFGGAQSNKLVTGSYCSGFGGGGGGYASRTSGYGGGGSSYQGGAGGGAGSTYYGAIFNSPGAGGSNVGASGGGGAGGTNITVANGSGTAGSAGTALGAGGGAGGGSGQTSGDGGAGGAGAYGGGGGGGGGYSANGTSGVGGAGGAGYCRVYSW